jgi:hypothetical protein
MSVSSEMAVAYARRYAESNMTAEVDITRFKDPLLNALTGDLTPVWDTGVYSGKARVYVLVGPVLLGIGDESQEFQNSYVSIPISVVIGGVAYTTDPRVDDLVTVTAHDDPLMVGRAFRVTDVESGGQYPAVRRMHVMGVEDTSHWVDSGSPVIPDAWVNDPTPPVIP